MLNPFSRTELLLGRDAMERLAASRVADIYKTRVDPPTRVMRRELRDRGIRHLQVVYSPEPAAETRQLEAPSPGRRSVPASVPWVPSTAGILMASAIARNLIANESE